MRESQSLVAGCVKDQYGLGKLAQLTQQIVASKVLNHLSRDGISATTDGNITAAESAIAGFIRSISAAR